eukprot:gene16167-11563_t
MEWYHVFFQSFLIFWPIERSKVSVTLVIDGELQGTPFIQRHVIDVINNTRESFRVEGRQGQFPPVHLKYQHHPVKNAWNSTTGVTDYSLLPYKMGYLRQQYVGFTADHYTNATFVGIVDTDTIFHSLVDREDIFEDGKPIIHGWHSLPPANWRWMLTTLHILRKEMPMQCMTYFPMTIKTAHLREIREYIAKLHGVKDFDEFFGQHYTQAKNSYCQFCIMCTYVFWFKRDEYVWRVRDQKPNWDGNNPRPPNGYYGDKSIWRPGELGLGVYVADHVRYRFDQPDLVSSENNRHALYLHGLCSHPSESWSYPNVNCSVYRERFPYFSEWFSFEYIHFDRIYGHQEAIAKGEARLERFKGCDFSYVTTGLKNVMGHVSYTQQDIDKMLQSVA